jgi:uncharacterized protein
VHDSPDTPRLLPRAFDPLPLGQVKPSGWLERQLRLQAAGLSGHLDRFWPDVARSRWIGGDAEGWERGPYWLDGAIPLAHLSGDGALIARTTAWVDGILAGQHDDGWLGPRQDETYGYALDPWPVFIVFKALVGHAGATGDARVAPAMLRFTRRLGALLEAEHLRSWAHYRWADMVLSLHWLFERTGEEWVLDCAARLQQQGFDWYALSQRYPFRYRSRREECDLRTHVVNNAMGVKAAGVWQRQSHDPRQRAGMLGLIDVLDRYHGQANGMFSGDEHLAGRQPFQGTELCAVVEFMYSLETLIAISGSAALADRLELVAFNALPATLSPDHWSHQYDQQVNQVVCHVTEDRVYTSNGPDANIFGLEPHYGCCTANLHQGWPKFAASLVMRSSDGGLAVAAYAPCTAETDIEGQVVRLEVVTDYPFRETVKLRLTGSSTEPVPLHLRVPAWCTGASLRGVDGSEVYLSAGFQVVRVVPADAAELQLTLPMRPRVIERDPAGASIYRGPLLFGLRIEEDWRRIGGQSPHDDWEVHPRSPWNYGVVLDRERPEASLRFEDRPLAEQPFSPDGAPAIAHVNGARLDDWTLEHGAAGPLPVGMTCRPGSQEPLTLLPYGATNLRIAQFPLIEP